MSLANFISEDELRRQLDDARVAGSENGSESGNIDPAAGVIEIHMIGDVEKFEA